jgi:hypothetical protein
MQVVKAVECSRQKSKDADLQFTVVALAVADECGEKRA